MNAKHTPGPWHVGFRSGANGNMVMAYTGKDQHEDLSICNMYGLPINCHVDEMTSERHAEGLANARLIAAAPELLEIIEECVNGTHGDCTDWTRRARILIARAKGEA